MYQVSEAQEILSKIRVKGGPKEALRMERLAKGGEVHPDPEIAALSLRWAQLVLSMPPRHARLDANWLLRAMALVVEIISAGWLRSFSESVHERRSRRLAEHIVQAHQSQQRLVL